MTTKNKRHLPARLRNWFLGLFKLTNRPVVRVYSGYGNTTSCVLFGHVLSLSPLPRKRYRQNIFINAISLLRLFMVKPLFNAHLRLNWEGVEYNTRSEKRRLFPL